MACPQGYVEINGQCQWQYVPGDANLDGTPNMPADQGHGFWSNLGNLFNQYGPAVLIGAGTWWQSRQNPTLPPGATNNPPPPAPAKTGPPKWIWVAASLVLVIVLVLVLRRRAG